MIHATASLRIRILVALLLAVVGLQAVPARAVGMERHHGSAFDISTVEVSIGPYHRKGEAGEVRVVGLPVPVFAARPLPRLALPVSTKPRGWFPPPTGPPLHAAVASLALAPRAPPHA